MGRTSEDLPSGHAHSEKYERSSRVLILVLDLEANAPSAAKNRTDI